MTTEIEQVRAIIQDPAPPDGVLSDADIQIYLDLADNDVLSASISASTSLAMFYAKKVDIKAGPVSIKNSQKAKAYESLVKSLRQTAREGMNLDFSGTLTGTSVSDIDAANADEDRYPSVFYRGVTDNPDLYENDERANRD